MNDRVGINMFRSDVINAATENKSDDHSHQHSTTTIQFLKYFTYLPNVVSPKMYNFTPTSPSIVKAMSVEYLSKSSGNCKQVYKNTVKKHHRWFPVSAQLGSNTYSLKFVKHDPIHALSDVKLAAERSVCIIRLRLYDVRTRHGFVGF